MIKIKKAFTLVELIVVITILAILGTIAFISLQGYSKSSRDSVRISDVSNMKTSLELFHLNAGKYPLPDDNMIVDYDSEILWYQGDFGNSVVSSLSRNLTKVPTDPLTDKKYIYSVANNKNEFEILTLLEGDIALNTSTQTNAANIIVTPKINGTYNGVFIKTSNYIVPVPSLINSEVDGTDLTLSTTNIKSQITNNGKNIPNLGNINHNTGALINLTLNATGTINKDSTNEQKLSVYQAIYDTYTGTTLANDGVIQIILNQTTDEEKIAITKTIVLSNTTTVAIVTPNNCDDSTKPSDDLNKIYTVNPTSINQAYVQDSNECGYTCTNSYTGTNCEIAPISDWRSKDPNCDKPDVTIGTQTWAGCNSTIGTGIEFVSTQDTSCRNYEGTNVGITCSNTENLSTSKANAWFTGTNVNGDSEVNNIWGKLYTWDNSSSACSTGYHVPTDAEWEYAEEFLFEADGGATNCRTTDGWECDGIGWKLHSTTNATNNLAVKLQLPLSGLRNTDGSTFTYRGNNTYFWSSTEYDASNARGRNLDQYNSTVYRGYRDKSYGFSVRCIKD